MKKLVLIPLFLILSGCGYKLGFVDRQLPEGYKQVSIPVFQNNTHETGVEVYFTNALIGQFALSKVAQVVSKNVAPVRLEGTITKIQFVSESKAKRKDPSKPDDDTPVPTLPKNAALTTKYRIYISARLKLRRLSDNKVLWQAPFYGEKDYSAPLLETKGINSANALYNHSARHKEIAAIANTMMVEAHDRISESF